MNFIQLYFAEGNVKCSNKNVTFLCRGCLMPSLVSNSKEVIEDRCRPSLTVLRTSLLNKLNMYIVPLGLNFIYRGTFFYRFEDPDPERTAKSDHFNAKIRIFENVKKKSSEITSSYSFTLI